MSTPVAIASGYSPFLMSDGGDDGSGGRAWWLFRGHLTRDEILNFRDDNDIHAYAGGPGMGFARRPTVRHSASYTLIVQCCGLDV